MHGRDPIVARRRLRAQRQLELEAEVGVLEPVAVELAQAAQAVAHRLGMHVQRGGDLLGAPAVAQPGQQRLGQPLARGRRLGVERRERRRRDVARQPAVGVEQQGEGVVGRRRAGPSPPRQRPVPRQRRASRGRAPRSRRLRASRTEGPSAPSRRAKAASSCARRPGRVGVGHQRADVPRRSSAAIASVAEPHREAVGLVALASRPRERAPAAASPPRARPPRRRRVGRRVLDEQRRRAAGAGAGAPRRPRPAPSRSPRSTPRELVDVGEDRLGEQVERPRLEPGRSPAAAQPPPGDAGAEAVGGQQRVEAAAGAQLAAAEVDVDLRGRRRARRRCAPPGRELRAAPRSTPVRSASPKRALERHARSRARRR